MRKSTYEKLIGHSGYISTKQLLNIGITNRQIALMEKEEILEKVCHGHYWIKSSNDTKPDQYKAIEVCLSDPNAVVCADSACFLHGLIDMEPERLSIATQRNDRRQIKMNFPVSRHYYSEKRYQGNIKQVETRFGRYAIYDLEKSVCDSIYFKKDIEEEKVYGENCERDDSC